MNYNNNDSRSEKGNYAINQDHQALSRPSWASRSTSVPTVAAAAAAAPPPESLYDELLRYHSDDDDDDDDEYSSRWRRRNLRTHNTHMDPTGSTANIPGTTIPNDPMEDRKPSAKPKAAPTTTATTHRTQHYTRSESPGSFYQAALEASQQHQQHHHHPSSSPPNVPLSSISSSDSYEYKRPGVVQVNEPAIRPNSAMYRAAYGNTTTTTRDLSTNSSNSNSANNNNITRSGSHGRLFSANMGGSRYSATAPTRNRSSDDATFALGERPTPNQTFRRNSKGRGPIQLNPPELMMQIGNDEHIASGRKSPGNTILGKNPVLPPGGGGGTTSSRGALGPRTYPQPTTPQVPAPQHQYSAPSMRGRMAMAGRLQPTSHSSDALPTNSSHTISSVQSVPTRLGNQYRPRSAQQGLSSAPTPKPTPTTSSGGVDAMSAMHATNPSTATATSSLSISQHHHSPVAGLRQPQRPRPSFDPRPSLTHPNPASSSPGMLDDPDDMDDDLRMALEISKHDTGRMMGPPSSLSSRSSLEPPSATGFGGRTRSLTPADLERPLLGRPNPMMTVHLDDPTSAAAADANVDAVAQSSFTRDAMAHAMHGASSTSLRDLMLALKLSEDSTNLEDLLAWEQQERESTTNTDQDTPNMTDYVAAGISTNVTSPTSTTTTATSNMTTRSMPTPLSSMPLSITATTTSTSTSRKPAASTTAAASDQARIWEKIRQEQEQKELELALEASKKEESAARGGSSSSTTTRTNTTTNNNSNTNNTSSSLTRTPSLDSEGRRRELLRRGTNETEQAILSGQSHLVICRGCNGRLQAPLGYSLVYCPECQTISPA